ncbi:exlusion protein FxsA [Thalassobacter stenotrophicus]|uniref:FxsA family protein n=1 Tax=Thalassobacter TaxID=266808 RepID=UPI00051D8D5F|nr:MULTISPECIES: FxsA family protein [Thalassobacter]KGK78631.1 exlusion protein FxsA [Thalassobacter stenotrophicus]KGL00641.1 exlusion protein FxsA [Thalassobacter sp. 16PALIMAR09]
MWLFLLFVGVPVLEIALFLQVGGWLGMWPTLGIVILTAAVGTVLVRSQGLAQLAKLQNSFQEMRDPTETLAHGAMVLASGLLLLTPGFFTDGVGFALLVPGVRSVILRYVRSKVRVQSFQYGAQAAPRAEDDIIDLTVDAEPRDRPSGWAKPD